MNYHNITHDDMVNGDGIRVVLWVAGCEHKCQNCHNLISWDADGGIKFDEKAKEELFQALEKEYISGITFSGGDPLHPNNIGEILYLINIITKKYPSKNIWIYTGYTFEEINKDEYKKNIIENIDVLVDGRFDEKLLDNEYYWAGSKNQRVIDIQKTKEKGSIILYEHN